MGYVTVDEMKAYGIHDPAAEDLIERASDIIDLHMKIWPVNDDGRLFPRVADSARGIPEDEVVPVGIKRGTLEQIIYMLMHGDQFIRQGGDDALLVAYGGLSVQKEQANPVPLLAPLAHLHIKPYITKVGFFNVR